MSGRAGRDGPPVVARELKGRAILPATQAPLRTFMVAMAVMSFLAAMAVSGMLMTQQATERWRQGVISEATVQIMPLGEPEARIAARIDAARALLERAEGIAHARVLSVAENRAMLAPWLGGEGLLEELPLPRLIAVTLDAKHPPDLPALARRLEERVKGARLDSHGRWVAELSHMARTVRWLGVGILLAVAAAAVGLVAYAARSALEANRETIEVLHLIGASDRFIAKRVERRFIAAGALAAAAGVAAAFAALVLVMALAPVAGLREHIRAMLFTDAGAMRGHYPAWLLIVIVAVALTLASTRGAVMRILSGMFAGR
ncbi:MAG TPA: ABC transporter permease [Thermopetrobacter sp.]|nr:ABC transporter permease [Thermopetrobacter sp.]